MGCVGQNAAFDPVEGKGRLYEYAEFYNSGTKDYSLSELLNGPIHQFLPLESENQSTGFTSDSYWVRFKLKNTNNQPQIYYLETARPITDFAEL